MALLSTLRPLFKYIARQRGWLLLIAALTIASAAVVALQPLPLKLLVDSALADGAPPAALTRFLALFGLRPSASTLIVTAAAASVGVFLLSAALTSALSLAWTVGGQRLIYDLGADVFAKLQRLSLRFHVQHSVGDSLSRLTGDTRAVQGVLNGLLMGPVQRIITLATMSAVGFALDPVLALLSLAAAPLLALSALYFGKPLKRRATLSRESHSRISGFVQQTFSALPLVKTFATEDRNKERFESLADEAVELARQGRLLQSAYGLINGTILATGTAMVLFVGGLRVLSGAIPLGTLLVFASYIRRMQDAAGGLFTIGAKLKAAEASAERLAEVLESKDEVTEHPDARPLPSGRRVQGHVVLERVSFGYEPSRPVLRDLDLEGRPGEMIAIVGPTGAGKSTLVSLIPRFVDPWEGRVLLDGVDVRQVTLQSLRSQIAVVLQEPLLLPLTIAENIAYGRPGATHDQVVAAASAARAHEFIGRLPAGYDTVIGERGATLSGGERQRISIARAFLKDAPVLILDEPTSALDAQTEAALLEALEGLMEGRTTFVITHRLSTARRADRIAAVEGGRIVELGRHRDLLEQRGVYHRLHANQLALPGAAR